MSERPEIDAAIELAIVPNVEDTSSARSFVLEKLEAGLVDILVLRDEFCRVRGIAEPGSRDTVLYRGDSDMADIRNDAVVRWHRSRASVDQVITDLVSEGLISSYEIATRDVQYRTGAGFSAGARVSSPALSHQGMFGLAPRFRPIDSEVLGLLAANRFLEGIEGLLGKRGSDCVRESLDAYRARLYLASVNLLGAACEAAWYAAGAQLATVDNDINLAINGTQTSRVVNRVADALRGTVKQHRLNELMAFENHLRELRNYGIHPREDDDTGLAAAFSETGAWCLISQCHRHLKLLNGYLNDWALTNRARPTE